MNSNKNDKNVDVNEVAITLGVDSEVIQKVRSGEITRIALDINDGNYGEILEAFDGNLVLVTEEMPDTFHGCYFYNGGEFPYAIKSTLDYLALDGDDDHCLAKIIDIEMVPGMRFNYQGAGKILCPIGVIPFLLEEASLNF